MVSKERCFKITGKMAQTTKQERGRTVGLIEAGTSMRAAAHQVKTSPATVSKWWNRYQAQGNVDDLPRSGRPRVTSAAEEESEQVHKA